MKKSAKPSAIKSKNNNNNYGLLIKLISGIILGTLSFSIISKIQRLKQPPVLDLNPILPPNGSILKSIAIPRVSGTAGNLKVREFIKSQFNSKFWELEEDVHFINSAHGQSTKFVNLIFTLKTKTVTEKRLILAAHYDSKLLEAQGKGKEQISNLKESKFIGASDSAWSCSLMISLAQAIQNESNLKQNFQLIFFDGEEAVHNWSPTDSLYGSRALASKWSKLPKDSSFNSLDKISLMVLMDLIGTRDANKFYSFYPDNSALDLEFQELIRIERETKVADDFKTAENGMFQSSGQFKSYGGQAVEDDHTPFLPFKVPVLHLIPVPFPSVWHTPDDTLEALDPENCEKISKIIYKFIRNKLLAV